jgi:hypothetical protein
VNSSPPTPGNVRYLPYVDRTTRWLIEYGLEVTRRNWIELNFPDCRWNRSKNIPEWPQDQNEDEPREWNNEHESDLPRYLQNFDWME